MPFFLPSSYLVIRLKITLSRILSRKLWHHCLLNTVTFWCLSSYFHLYFLYKYYIIIFFKNQLRFFNGTRGNWTLDPLLARQMLSQLSYSPILTRRSGYSYRGLWYSFVSISFSLKIGESSINSLIKLPYVLDNTNHQTQELHAY